MDYLKQHNLASAPALFVICRYLATRTHGADESTLRGALQPQAIVSNERAAARDGERRDVLPASLEVGTDIGLFDAQGARRERLWSLRDTVRTEMLAVSSMDSRPFRSLVLRCLGERATTAIDAGEPPSDVAVGLTWLLQNDPLSPLPTSWGDGPEAAVQKARLDPAIGNSEQWRALIRWAKSLGLATTTATSGQKHSLVADPTKAVHDILAAMPRQAPADQWFRLLRSLLPVLGHPTLVSQLPTSTGSASEIPATTALAVQKLERAGRLRLVSSDDASSAVVLRVGNNVRQIGDVRVDEGSAA